MECKIIGIEDFYKSVHAKFHSRRYWKKKYKHLKPTYVFIIMRYFSTGVKKQIDMTDFMETNNFEYRSEGSWFFIKATDAEIMMFKMLISEYAEIKWLL